MSDRLRALSCINVWRRFCVHENSTSGPLRNLAVTINATSFLYEKGKKVDYYLKRAGGPTVNAEEDELYIIRADGSVQSKSQSGKLFDWDPDNNRWTYGSFKSANLYPGDTLLVPRKLVKVHWVKEFRDITQIMFQIAVAVGVVAAI